MTDVAVQAESSAAAPKFTQYDGWDDHGTPIVSKKPEPPKTEEPAASAAPATEAHSEPKGKTAAEPETAPSQEKRERKPGEKKSAEERIAELIAENKLLREDRERSRQQVTQPAPKAESEAKPKNAEPATYADWRKDFKPKEWVEKYAKDNPTASYEDATAAMADHIADQRDRYRQAEFQNQQAQQRAQEMLRKTIEQYPDADAKVKETTRKLTSPDVPEFVRDMIGSSEHMTDVLYALSDQTTLDNLIASAKSAPPKAIRALVEMEINIRNAVKKAVEPKAEEEPPAEPKPRAPKPPSVVGGRGTGQEDAAVAAARNGNFAAFEAAENAKMKARFIKA